MTSNSMFMEPTGSKLEIARMAKRATNQGSHLTYDCHHAYVQRPDRVACRKGAVLYPASKDGTASLTLILRGTALRVCSLCAEWTGPDTEYGG